MLGKFSEKNLSKVYIKNKLVFGVIAWARTQIPALKMTITLHKPKTKPPN